MTDPYVYPGTNTLINRLGIRDPVNLAQVEANRSALSIVRLRHTGLSGSYDLAHLQAFHREIFSSTYPWAGEIRTVAIAKTQLFALPQHIESYADDVFAGLQKENALKGLNEERFVERLTHYYAEINAGNGRTQRAFAGQLAREGGYEIHWERLDADRNIEASVDSLNGDNSKLHEIFGNLVEKQTSSPDTEPRRQEVPARDLVQNRAQESRHTITTKAPVPRKRPSRLDELGAPVRRSRAEIEAHRRDVEHEDELEPPQYDHDLGQEHDR